MNITAKNFELTAAIREYVTKKIDAALEDIQDDSIHTDVEVDKTTQHHQKGEVFHIRIHVRIPHGELYVEETRDDLYAAIDVAIDQLSRQIEDRQSLKKTRQRRARRTMRTLKSMLNPWNNRARE